MPDRKFTVLLVDDKNDNIISLEAMLEQHNRIFLKANSGNDALRVVKNNPDIGLILLDVQMPIMDGFEVARALKSDESTRNIPIIFVSAINKDYKDVLNGFDTGGFEYLSKPLDIQITRAKVKAFEELHAHKQYLNYSIEQKSRANEQLKKFMYVVAHDISAPLNGIITILNIIGQNQELNQNREFRDFFPLLKQSTGYLSEMVNSILSYSKTNIEQAIEDVDTYALVKHIAQSFSTPTTNFIVDSNLPLIKTTRLKLLQVFQHLISNAVKYNDKACTEIEIGCMDDELFYKFYVSDNGIGINKEDYEEIFMLFRTLGKTGSGIGVGLNVVRALVEEQGGKVTLKSVPREGSTFYFRWPKQ